mmetsp:Transcript_72697/g.194256  ORF Transcript_72697/g.194256 Transcript_72697/m.194256 type:complete len:87 (-) Transcript_72697:16-276(-)
MIFEIFPIMVIGLGMCTDIGGARRQHSGPQCLYTCAVLLESRIVSPSSCSPVKFPAPIRLGSHARPSPAPCLNQHQPDPRRPHLHQ